MTRIRKEKPGIIKRVLKACLLLLVLFLILSVLQVAVLRFVNPPFTMTMISNWLRTRWLDESLSGLTLSGDLFARSLPI